MPECAPQQGTAIPATTSQSLYRHQLTVYKLSGKALFEGLAQWGSYRLVGSRLDGRAQRARILHTVAVVVVVIRTATEAALGRQLVQERPGGRYCEPCSATKRSRSVRLASIGRAKLRHVLVALE